MELMPGDMIFTYEKGSAISRIIWKVCGIHTKRNREKRLSHMITYEGPGKIIDVQINGVIRGSVKKYSASKFELHGGRVASLPDRELLLHDARAAIGTTIYPLMQLIVLGLKELLGTKKSFDVSRRDMMCTEFVVKLHSAQGVDLVPGKEPYEVTPLDLFNSRLVETFPIGVIPS